MRSTEKKLTGDERQRGWLSLAVGEHHSRDPARMAEQTTDDGKT
jgi:hypothetical protein